MNKYHLLFAALSIFSSVFAHSQETIIEVFVDGPLEVPALPNAQIDVYDLSMPEKVKDTLLPTMPEDPVQAKLIAREFLNSPAGAHFQNSLRAAYAGKLKTIKYQVKKIPAIVFEEGRYVIYGSTDIIGAMHTYDQFLRMNRFQVQSNE